MIASVVILALWPIQALARAIVRFIHAVPGSGAADLLLTQGTRSVDLGHASFAQSTSYRNVRSGRFTWKLDGGGKTLASGNVTIGSGAWTVVVLAKGPGVALGVYRDRGGVHGTALLRLIHAAPELGSPNLTLDRHVVATGVGFSSATPYARVSAGTHALAAVKAGASMPLVSGSVTLKAGEAKTAVVLGSRGQRTRIVTVTDRGGPLTRQVTHAASRAGPPVAPASGATVLVHRGDSLWSIARAHLGPGASNARIAGEVQRIWDLNAIRIGTHDPNLIFPGTRLKFR